jgi:HEAT repeat protein
MAEPYTIERGRGAGAGRDEGLEYVLAGMSDGPWPGAVAGRELRALASDHHESVDCRRRALLALARIRPVAAETRALFIGVLRSEASPLLRWTAAMGLGRLGGVAAVRALEQAASEDFAEVGVYPGVPLAVADAAVAALSYLRSRRAMPALLR